MVSKPYGTKPKKKSHRRPHTSAGPSDKSNEFRIQPNTFERLKPGPTGSSGEVVPDERPLGVVVDGSGVEETPAATPSYFGWKRIVAPALSVTTSFNGAILRGQDNVSDDERLPEPRVDQSHVRAWEEELVKIEVQSRRSSKDLLSIFKRKKVRVVRDR